MFPNATFTNVIKNYRYSPCLHITPEIKPLFHLLPKLLSNLCHPTALKQEKMLKIGCGQTGTPVHCWWENGVTATKNSLQDSQEIKNVTST